MTTSVLLVNHGPDEVEVAIFDEGGPTGEPGSVSPDRLSHVRKIAAHTEAREFVHTGRYLVVRELPRKG